MLRALDVAYVDTAAAQLCLSLDQPPLPALAEVTLTGIGAPGVAVSLRLLGASHQVVVTDPAGNRSLIETVACLPGRPAGLPETLTRNSSTTGYRFGSSVRHDHRVEVERYARELTDRYQGDDRSLVGHYADDPAAVTAVAADLDRPGLVRWQSWHTYPQTGEIVRTVSTMARTILGPDTRPTGGDR